MIQTQAQRANNVGPKARRQNKENQKIDSNKSLEKFKEEFICSVPGCNKKFQYQKCLTNHHKKVHDENTKVNFPCQNNDKCDKIHHQKHKAEMCCKKWKCEVEGCTHKVATGPGFADKN